MSDHTGIFCEIQEKYLKMLYVEMFSHHAKRCKNYNPNTCMFIEFLPSMLSVVKIIH